MCFRKQDYMEKQKLLNFATRSFSLPDICLRIREVLDDNRSDAQDIGRLIALDPSLTAKILKLANSALFRFPSQVDSIGKAVSVIGGEALYNLVIAETANSAFKAFDNDLINLAGHRRCSVYCALVAKYMAKHAGIRGSERFFVMGILQNLSELVVAKYAPSSYVNYVSEPAGKLLPWERQQKIFGFDFASLSGQIMEAWQLPLPLFYPVCHTHDAQKHSNEQDIALLACALRVTIRENDKENYAAMELFTPAIANSLTLEGETVGSAIEYASQETDRMASLLH